MPVNPAPYSGWGRVLWGRGGRARPEKRAALARQLAEAPGPALGALRSYGDAALAADRPALDMSRMDRLIAFDAATGVLEAEAGVPLSEILSVFGPRGWMPATLPGTGHATLGGAIAADVHGKNHHAAGSLGQHVEAITLAGPDGATREVTAGSDPELFRATIGGMGLTGVIVSARVRLAPCPSGAVSVAERRVAGLDAFLEGFEASDATFQVGWIDATRRGEGLGRGILEEAEFTAPPAPFPSDRRAKAVPLDAPGFALSAPVVRTFNAAYYARVPASGRKRDRPLPAFFHPLDSLSGWNRLYGKRGFHQFQCVVPPDAAAETLRAMLEEIAAAGLAAPLAVLKRMGPGRAGMLSFPMEGVTLAVDIPNRRGAEALIRRQIDRAAEAGGRIYLAKDSLASPGQLAPMYPELDTFRAVCARVDPDGVFETDLARRLNLRGER